MARAVGTSYSNCLIVALIVRARLKGSVIHCKWTERSVLFPHFYVVYKDRMLWFKSAKDEPFYKHVCYEGRLTTKHIKEKKFMKDTK